MQDFSLVLFLVLVIALSSSCRKPDYTYYDPCNEVTRLRLIDTSRSLSAEERRELDSLVVECDRNLAITDKKGMLWPYLLGGAAGLILLIGLHAWLLTEPDIQD